MRISVELKVNLIGAGEGKGTSAELIAKNLSHVI